MRRKTVIAVLAGALVLSGASAATAAPPEREVIPLVCDNGETLDVVVNGMGEFTPGRVVGSNQVLVPISFGDFTFTAVPPGGGPVTDTFPGSSKGGGNVEARNPRETITCTFEETFTLEEDDPELGLPAGTVVTFSGSVTGYLTGR
ncbi:MAG: hypothetical protein ACOYXW_03610 [Actinomycetota bacterium]